MRSHRITALALVVLVCVTSAWAKDYLVVTSEPSGAAVEINGMKVGTTPFKLEIPGGYLHGTRSVFGKRLMEQMHLRLTLDGYLPKDVDLANGPYRFVTLNGVYHGDYWILKSGEFHFGLDRAATAFVAASLAKSQLAPPAPAAGSLEEVIKTADPAVLWLKGSEGTGSGFLLTPNGIAVTNAHVARDEEVMAATSGNGQSFVAKVVYIDPSLDIALVKLDGAGFPTLPIADPATAQLGSSVIAIGTPSQGMQNTVTKGIISAVGQMPNETGTWVQTDAAINPGNSGGPLLNSAGEVVGITTQKRFMSSDGRPLQGIGFALSSGDLMTVLRRFDPAVGFHRVSPAEFQDSGTAKVSINCDTDGAEIYVDGKFVGNPPSTLRLAAGSHKIEVRAPGRQSWERELEVLKDSEISLKANLPEVAEAK